MVVGQFEKSRGKCTIFGRLILQTDDRIGGRRRYRIVSEGTALMNVPDDIRKCVVFLGHQEGQSTVFGATAFFVGISDPLDESRGHMYLVTALHNLEKIESKGLYDAYIRFNLLQGGCRSVRTEIAHWRTHPTDDTVDAAVLPFDSELPLDHLVFPLEGFLSHDEIAEGGVGPGNSVFVVGLFPQHKGAKRNIPIIRLGSIAAMPEEPIFNVEKRFRPMEGYLIETRSVGGLSGSPVFFRREASSLFGSGPVGSLYLFGLIHGHWNWDYPKVGNLVVEEKYAEAFNMGISIVVPASKILEIINRPELVERRKKIEDKWADEGNAVNWVHPALGEE
jgi:hypothetical protein